MLATYLVHLSLPEFEAFGAIILMKIANNERS